MNKKDIFIGLIFIVLVVLFFVAIKIRVRNQNIPFVSPTPSVIYQTQIEDRFKLNIPDNLQKADLKNVSSTEGYGIVTRKFESGKFTLTVLANLPDPDSFYVYKVWVLKDSSAKPLYIGDLRIAKGGYLLDFESSTDYSDMKIVFVTLQKVTEANPSQKHIIEGSF